MSVDGLCKDPEIKQLFEPLLPGAHIKLGLTLKVPPQRNSGSLVGTAFDYAVRFELQRRHPHARARRWVAEDAVDRVSPIANMQGYMTRVDRHGNIASRVDGVIAARWSRVVRAARAAVDTYVRDSSRRRGVPKTLVKHALRLAKIDPYILAGYVEREPEAIGPSDVDEVAQMLAIVPWDSLGSESLVWLNPDFGDTSIPVGGAAADLICDSRLVDLKATTTPSPRRDLQQLIAYFILARAARRIDASFPEILSLCVYYARHGTLWTASSTSELTNRGTFKAIERRFFARAKELYGSSQGRS